MAVLIFGRVVVVYAINLKRGAACSGAVEIDGRAGGTRGVVLSSGRILLKTCKGLGECQEIARIKCRFVENLLSVQSTFDFGIRGIDGSGFRCDDHSLSHPCRFERKINYSCLIKGYLNALLYLREALLQSTNSVTTQRYE